MDYSQARAILDKFGANNCVQIILDNMRTVLCFKPKEDPNKPGYPLKDTNGHIIFDRFNDLIVLDEATDTIRYREYQHGVNAATRAVIRWDIVTPIECIQGFNFLPQGVSDKDAQTIMEQWDHTIV